MVRSYAERCRKPGKLWVAGELANGIADGAADHPEAFYESICGGWPYEIAPRRS